MLIVASAYAVIAFLCTYLAQGAMQALVKAMPAWLTHGFEVAGGILPAVGFGLGAGESDARLADPRL